MRRLVPFLGLLLLAAPALAQDWRMAPEYDVLLTTYDIEPREIRLQAGKPVRLRFVNTSNQKLSFSATRFFRSAKVRRRDADRLSDGVLEVGPLATETVLVVPKAGRYRTSGRNVLHRLLGMSGRIVVE
jgi:plastocyanin